VGDFEPPKSPRRFAPTPFFKVGKQLLASPLRGEVGTQCRVRVRERSER